MQLRARSWTPRCALGLFAVLLLAAAPAKAQYRNKSLGFDLSYMGVLKPTITGPDGLLLDPGDRGDRITRGIRLGGEGSFKLHRDHWWFTARLDVMSFMYGNPQGDSLNEIAERLAKQKLGFNMGLEGLGGVRYYFLTDRVRPYLQISLSYLHIFSFGSAASSPCTNTNVCDGVVTYGDALMPRRNFLGLHAAPSIEFVLTRDVALHVLVEYARWVTFRGKGNNVFTGGLGVTLYG